MMKAILFVIATGSMAAALDPIGGDGFRPSQNAPSQSAALSADSVDFQSLNSGDEIYNGPKSKLPLKIIKKIHEAGAILDTATVGEGLYVLDVEYPSKAYNRWKQYCQPNGIEPDDCERSDPRYMPVMEIGGGVPLHLIGPVYFELVKVLSLYAPLRQVDFQPGARLPALPAFYVPLPAGGFIFRHATIGAHKVFERISTGIGCPLVGSLARGCIVCRVNVQYSNCAFSLRIVKS
jgi:hypothetical protein